MQSAALSETNNADSTTFTRRTPSPPHHGPADDEPAVSPSPRRHEHGTFPESGSEWSLSQSTSPGQEPASDDDNTWLSLRGLDVGSLRLDEANVVAGISYAQTQNVDRAVNADLRKTEGIEFGLNRCPEEILFHVFSHLSASDLLVIKLVSRRFYDLVTSPLAWVNAFSNFFPGQNALRGPPESVPGDNPTESRKSVAISFTRLSNAASWTGEYLLRAKLLRCLARGRPTVPFAALSPGKPHKGFATFTFSPRTYHVNDRIDAQFGDVADKRLPLFIHGSSSDGTVSCSDRRGEFHGWGQRERRMFRTADSQYSGMTRWGLGSASFVVVPNSMDVSSRYGVIVGEGLPGGHVHFLAGSEKHGRYLAPYPEAIQRNSDYGMAAPPHMQSITCVWIAKSPTIPRITHGLIGLMSGSSSGIVSAYSLGVSVNHSPHHERGELVARWILCPGIPIVSIKVDEDYSQYRAEKGRIWAVALNAFGEVFYIRGLPVRADMDSRQFDPDAFEELRAWHTAQSADWHMVDSSRRSPKNPPDDLPTSQTSHKITQPTSKIELEAMKFWLIKTPAELRSLYSGWDMRRFLELDFGGCKDPAAGENVMVFHSGRDSANAARVTRYTRLSVEAHDAVHSQEDTHPPGTSVAQPASLQNEPLTYGCDWVKSTFNLSTKRADIISTTAIDSSKLAINTYGEDLSFYYKSRVSESQPDSEVNSHLDPDYFVVPGQRARLFAAGTKTGTVYIWDCRAPASIYRQLTGSIEAVAIIQTDSPAITSLALSSLVLFHGGSDGCVQAWDPLLSTREPIRTLFSRPKAYQLADDRFSAQDNPAIVRRMRKKDAANAIYVDPDPKCLRGILAVGSQLRYWSFSSSSAREAASKAQRRRANRAVRASRAGTVEGLSTTKRLGFQMVVDEEIANQQQDAKDRLAEEKAYQKFAKRFGTELLGKGTSEEELVAYAKMLSEETELERESRSSLKKLHRDASEAEVAAHISSLSPEEYERWKYASWEQRFEIPASGATTVLYDSSPRKSEDQTNIPDHDLAEAIRASLLEAEAQKGELDVLGWQPTIDAETRNSDEDFAEAVRRSLAQPQPASTIYTSSVNYKSTEDDISMAVALSLQEQEHTDALSPRQQSVSSHEFDSVDTSYDSEFPSLGSGSTRTIIPAERRGSKGKGRAP